jgi:IS30 family transposase
MVALFSCKTEKLQHLREYLRAIPSSQNDEVSGRTAPYYEASEHKRQYRIVTKGEATEIIRAYQSGESTGSIAKRLGRSRNGVGLVLKRHGIEIRTYSPSEAVVKQMVEMYELGQSLATIGKRYNVSPATVSKHLRKQGVKIRTRY